MPYSLNVCGIAYRVDRLCNVCPKCHHAIQGRYEGWGREQESVGALEVALECPNCFRLFIAVYVRVRQNPETYALKRLEAGHPTTPTFGLVEELSPQFAKIYGQAAAAESYGLEEIAGVGYRKALEFLVKDFCISKHADHVDDIKKKPLGRVMQDYLEDGRIKEAAKRTAWLGNDETHYERKWEGKDLSDLKALLHMTVTGISESIEFDRYMSDMQDPR